MPDDTILRQLPQICQNRPTSERLEGRFTDEASGRLSHDHVDCRTVESQPAGQLRDLVGRDTAADAEDNMFSGDDAHSRRTVTSGQDAVNPSPEDEGLEIAHRI